MALFFSTEDSKKLLSTFKRKIDEGHIKTWSYDSDGDFTHNTDQWRNQAWLSPSHEVGRLKLKIIKPKNKNVSGEVYAIYHGRFIESMLAHCDTLFDQGIGTARATAGDLVSS